MTTEHSPAAWGGPRENAGRKRGGHNRMSAEQIRQAASRHAVQALTALSDIVANPSQPGAEARAIAARTIVTTATQQK